MFTKTPIVNVDNARGRPSGGPRGRSWTRVSGFGETPLNEITRRAVKDFVADLTRVKTARSKDGKPARPNIRILASNLCTVLSHAVDDEIIPTNPATRMPRHFKQATVRHAEIEPLTAEGVSALLSASIAHDMEKRYRDVPDLYPLLLCAVHTGMRAGELAGLQWEDIDWQGKFLKVRRGVKYGKIQPTKTRKARQVDMSDEWVSTLENVRRARVKEWLARGPEERQALQEVGLWDDTLGIPKPVFCNSDGGLFDIQNLKNRHFHKVLKDAKLRQIRFHDFRHTFASLLIQNGE